LYTTLVLLVILILIGLAIIFSVLLLRNIREFLKQLLSWSLEEMKSIASPDKEKNVSRMAGDITTDAPLPKNDKKKNSKIKSATKGKIRKRLDID
jgi:uncharacterized protein YeeX (DUF496 family)